jgi:hypothetical protein
MLDPIEARPQEAQQAFVPELEIEKTRSDSLPKASALVSELVYILIGIHSVKNLRSGL